MQQPHPRILRPLGAHRLGKRRNLFAIETDGVGEPAELGLKGSFGNRFHQVIGCLQLAESLLDLPRLLTQVLVLRMGDPLLLDFVEQPGDAFVLL